MDIPTNIEDLYNVFLRSDLPFFDIEGMAAILWLIILVLVAAWCIVDAGPQQKFPKVDLKRGGRSGMVSVTEGKSWLN